ncbi:YdeI/OmpD-associated family protein [Specibacter cremeus]|uniref:YdeI/OmpD-associated family protein n=1 Tax=Specibacter cremeus TaxID=1629051 RepID=UPI000F7AEEA6|nr:hypothetical protein [Specibacter cremeus]
MTDLGDNLAVWHGASESVEGVPAIRAEHVQAWRDWLSANSYTVPEIWLIIHDRGAGTPSVGFHDAIEHALCFGWVDSRAVRRDHDSVYVAFAPRHPSTVWGPASRRRAERMIEAGLMRPPGQHLIDQARAAGTWEAPKDARARS